MKCKKKKLVVVNNPSICTNSIIVSENGSIFYVDPLTRLTKTFPEEQPCAVEEEADLYEGFKDDKRVFFTQEDKVKILEPRKVNGTISGTALLMPFVEFLDLFDFDSNNGKSIYDKDSIELHRQRLYRNRILEKMTATVTRTFFTGSYRDVTSTLGNIMNSIGGQAIFESFIEPGIKILVEKCWQIFSLVRAIFDGYCLIVYLFNHDCSCLKKNSGEDQNDVRITVINNNEEDETDIEYRPNCPPPPYGDGSNGFHGNRYDPNRSGRQRFKNNRWNNGRQHFAGYGGKNYRVGGQRGRGYWGYDHEDGHHSNWLDEQSTSDGF